MSGMRSFGSLQAPLPASSLIPIREAITNYVSVKDWSAVEVDCKQAFAGTLKLFEDDRASVAMELLQLAESAVKDGAFPAAPVAAAVAAFQERLVKDPLKIAGRFCELAELSSVQKPPTAKAFLDLATRFIDKSKGSGEAAAAATSHLRATSQQITK